MMPYTSPCSMDPLSANQLNRYTLSAAAGTRGNGRPRRDAASPAGLRARDGLWPCAALPVPPPRGLLDDPRRLLQQFFRNDDAHAGRGAHVHDQADFLLVLNRNLGRIRSEER